VTQTTELLAGRALGGSSWRLQGACMGGRCGTVWSVCLCSEACAGRCGARDGAVVGRAASARRIFQFP